MGVFLPLKNVTSALKQLLSGWWDNINYTLITHAPGHTIYTEKSAQKKWFLGPQRHNRGTQTLRAGAGHPGMISDSGPDEVQRKITADNGETFSLEQQFLTFLMLRPPKHKITFVATS